MATKLEENALGKFYSPKLETVKQPGHLVLTSREIMQVQSDGSYAVWDRKKKVVG